MQEAIVQVGSLSAKKYIRRVLIRTVPVTLIVGFGIVSFSSDAGTSSHETPTAAVAQTIHLATEWSAGLVR
jgi:hypothetical protein